MWPFGRKPTDADRAIAVFDDAIGKATEKWIFFSEAVNFKDEVPLGERIATFSIPMFDGLRANFPALQKAPDAVLLLIVAKEVEKSGTNSRDEIEQALGTTLPD